MRTAGGTTVFIKNHSLCIRNPKSLTRRIALKDIIWIDRYRLYGGGLGMSIYRRDNFISTGVPVNVTMWEWEPKVGRSLDTPHLMDEIRQANPQVMYSGTDNERAQCRQRYREMCDGRSAYHRRYLRWFLLVMITLIVFGGAVLFWFFGDGNVNLSSFESLVDTLLPVSLLMAPLVLCCLAGAANMCTARHVVKNGYLFVENGFLCVSHAYWIRRINIGEIIWIDNHGQEWRNNVQPGLRLLIRSRRSWFPSIGETHSMAEWFVPQLMAEIRQVNPQVMYSETDDERAQCHSRYREMRRTH